MKHWLLLFLAGWLPFADAGLPGDDELLPAEQAFSFQATMASNDRIRAVWDIADGYYLYKSKFRFATDAEGIRLGDAVLPAGKIKQDEFFGDIETYRQQLVVEIPLIREAGAANSFELKAGSQGCADIGVCYPPQTQLAALTIADNDTPAPGGGALQALNDLGAVLGFGSDDELLPADQAFQLDVQASDADTLTANWLIAEGYYLYRHTFEFAID